MRKVFRFGLRSFILFSVLAAIALSLFVRSVESRLTEYRQTSDRSGRSIWTVDYKSDSDRTAIDRILGIPAKSRLIDIDGLDEGALGQLNALDRLSILNSLDVSNFSDNVIGKLTCTSIESLRHLRVARCSPQVVKFLIEISPNIVDLEVYDCKDVTDHDLSGVGRLRLIRSLVIDGSSIAGLLFNDLRSCLNLESIKVRWSPCCTAENLCQLRYLPSLRQVSLKGDGRYLDVSQLACLRNTVALELDGFALTDQMNQ